MSRAQFVEPSVATYFDHEVITPPNKLRRLVSTVPDDEADDPVARAEQALAQLSSEFSGWMQEESERLDRARAELRAHGFNKATREALFHSAHDIKGEAATFGYPWVAAIADSLCRLIEHTPDMMRIPMILVEQHARLALGLTDEVLVLDRGRVVHRGASAALLSDQALQDRLLSVG